MTASEIFNLIIQSAPIQISNFNAEIGINYEIFNDDTVQGGISQNDYNNLVADAYNWNDNTMNDVNAQGNVAGIKPKQREGDPTPD